MKIAWRVLVLGLMIGPGFADSLQERVDHLHKTRQEPSESVVIGKLSGSEMEFAAAGVMKVNGDKPDQETLYEIGSITKVFTAILLAETVREGKANLKDPVAIHLPDSTVTKESPLFSTITLESLATHRSGLPRLPADLFTGADPANPYAHYDEKRLHAFLKSVTAETLEKPGVYSYSNLGFGLLGNALEHIWGKPYPDLVREGIFEPLGMMNSLVPTNYKKLSASVREKLATGHNGGKAVPHWELGSLLGAGAILSSARDLLLFAKGHWDEKTPQGLAQSLEEAARIRHDGIGLGWMISGEKISHGGGTGGFRTHLAINLAEKTAEVTLKNSAGESMEQEKIGEFSGVSGFWEGTLDVGATKLRLVFHIGDDGRIIQFSIDQGCGSMEAAKTSYENDKLTASFPGLSGYFEADRKGDQLVGTWSQSGDLPLTLTRSKIMPKSLQDGLAAKFPDDLTALQGYWSGYLGGKQGLFVFFTVESMGNGFLAHLNSPDQMPTAIPVSRFERKENKVLIKVDAVGGTFNGIFEEETKTLEGTWKQLADLPLKLEWSKERPKREPK